MKKILQALTTWIHTDSIARCKKILAPHDVKLQRLTSFLALWIDYQEWQKNNLQTIIYTIDTELKTLALDKNVMDALLQCVKILPRELYVSNLFFDFYTALTRLSKNPFDKTQMKILEPQNTAILFSHFYVLTLDKSLVKTIMHSVK